MIYKATAKFKELDESSAYQGLTKDQFNGLMSGKSVEVENMPGKLLKGKYVEADKSRKSKEK